MLLLRMLTCSVPIYTCNRIMGVSTNTTFMFLRILILWYLSCAWRLFYELSRGDENSQSFL